MPATCRAQPHERLPTRWLLKISRWPARSIRLAESSCRPSCWIRKMTPKWTGSTPNFMTSGSNIGAKRRIAGMPSIKQPMIISKMFNRKRISHLFWVTQICCLTIIRQALETANNQLKRFAAPIMNRTIEVLTTVSLKHSTSFFKLSSLWMNIPTNNAYSAARTPSSASVTAPVATPAMMINGIASAEPP